MSSVLKKIEFICIAFENFKISLEDLEVARCCLILCGENTKKESFLI